MGDRLQLYAWYVTKTTRSTQPCIHPGSLNWVPALIGCAKGRNVTSVRWQVTLCDPIWVPAADYLLQTAMLLTFTCLLPLDDLRFYAITFLLAIHASASKHWKELVETVAWPHSFYIHNQSLDGTNVTPFMPALWHKDQVLHWLAAIFCDDNLLLVLLWD